MQVADAFLFLDCGLVGQPFPIDCAFSGVGIHREIANLKRGEVLKEVAALRRSHAEIAEACLHDGARSGNFVPFDGDAEPGIVRSPAAYANQQVGTVLGVQAGVEVSHGLGHLLTAASLEAMGIHHHNVMKIFDAAVAQNFCAAAEHLGWVNVVDRKVLMVARQRERANLEESEIGGLFSARKADGEFDLHGIAQGILSGSHQ